MIGATCSVLSASRRGREYGTCQVGNPPHQGSRGVADLFPRRSSPGRSRARGSAWSSCEPRCRQRFGLPLALSLAAPLVRRHSDLDIITVIGSLFPEGVRTVTAAGDADPPPLLPDEEPCMRRAVKKRRREFAAGRACARKALEFFGIYNRPLPVGPDRAPVWPAGIVGSITHCEEFVAAAVARRGLIRGIGVDVERSDPLDPEVAQLICSPQEWEWSRGVAPPDSTDWLKVIFSAKEAAYKCLAPWCKRPFGFHDVEIAVHPAQGRFAVRLRTKAGFPYPNSMQLDGRFATSPTHVFTAVLLTAGGVAVEPQPSTSDIVPYDHPGPAASAASTHHQAVTPYRA